MRQQYCFTKRQLSRQRLKHNYFFSVRARSIFGRDELFEDNSCQLLKDKSKCMESLYFFFFLTSLRILLKWLQILHSYSPVVSYCTADKCFSWYSRLVREKNICIIYGSRWYQLEQLIIFTVQVPNQMRNMPAEGSKKKSKQVSNCYLFWSR